MKGMLSNIDVCYEFYGIELTLLHFLLSQPEEIVN